MKRGSKYFREIGRKGGQTTVSRHGREHMRRIGRKGFQVTTEKYFSSREEHVRFLHSWSAYSYWASTNLPMKRDRHGSPIWPEEPPTHPAHDDHVPF